MPYGTPTSSPNAAEYSAGFTSPDGVGVRLLISGPNFGQTEAQRDAAFQAAVDTMATLGWTFASGGKGYSTTEEITVTP